MKPKIHGWKEGIITEDLRSYGSALAGKYDFRKGDTVRYRKFKKFDERNFWTGKYEYHYIDLNNYNLVRSDKLLVNEKEKK